MPVNQKSSSHSGSAGTCSILDAELHAQVTHLANLARNPGWIDYARARAKELEQIWPGIVQMVRDELKVAQKE